MLQLFGTIAGFCCIPLILLQIFVIGQSAQGYSKMNEETIYENLAGSTAWFQQQTEKMSQTAIKISQDALVRNADMGTQRESFFLNQLRGSGHELFYPPKGDFLVDGEWLFEVGGKGKKFAQIKDAPKSYVAYDDVEIGFGNKIPLWLFGFLY